MRPIPGERESDDILLTPDSFFHSSATNTKSLISPTTDSTVAQRRTLPVAFDNVRRAPLDDAPERSEYSSRLKERLREHLAYLHTYPFSEYESGLYKEVQDLPKPIREVGLALRVENQRRLWAMWLREEPYEGVSE
ncbi:hypothetical protein DXG03_004325 [Asterophora parasitica]|uniref:Uncharacterized protein n=1 Tax=Asterophora parasitica TaxID=117018 RepID=A0A9P7K653_9AGAR|nr:hypothetical protein DXG03_004325 [Asterophora parasitica]